MLPITQTTLGKAYKLWISRPAIRRDPTRLELVLHVNLSGGIEFQSSSLHDPQDLGLGRIVKPSPTVARVNVAMEIKGVASETGFNVISEGGREARVNVVSTRDIEVVEKGKPVLAEEVDSCAEDECGGAKGVEVEAHDLVGRI